LNLKCGEELLLVLTLLMRPMRGDATGARSNPTSLTAVKTIVVGWTHRVTARALIDGSSVTITTRRRLVSFPFHLNKQETNK